MNAITSIQADVAACLIQGARRYLARPYRTAPERAACFDCVAFVNDLTGAQIAPAWMEDGGDVPFTPICVTAARPGDILIFRMPWQARPWHMAVMTAGRSVDDQRARLIGPYYGHACVEAWIAPMWRRHLVRAVRVEAL